MGRFVYFNSLLVELEDLVEVYFCLFLLDIWLLCVTEGDVMQILYHKAMDRDTSTEICTDSRYREYRYLCSLF